MFTVRHIEPSGHETIVETRRVSAEPSLNVGGGPSVFYEEPSGAMRRLIGGKVYVMNETGKTVAKYELNSVSAPVGEG